MYNYLCLVYPKSTALELITSHKTNYSEFLPVQKHNVEGSYTTAFCTKGNVLYF